MKLIKLSLSDSGYNKALELAGLHTIPLEAYLAGELEDLLDQKSQRASNMEARTITPSPAVASTFRPTFPAGLEQMLCVCEYVYGQGLVPTDERQARDKFSEAVQTVAKNTEDSKSGKKGVEESTIRDKFSDRRFGKLAGMHIDTAVILGMLCEPERLRDCFCRAFPRFMNEIHQKFATWLPNRFGTAQ